MSLLTIRFENKEDIKYSLLGVQYFHHMFVDTHKMFRNKKFGVWANKVKVDRSDMLKLIDLISDV